jgi:predicted PurR-regulated permease PerM
MGKSTWLKWFLLALNIAFVVFAIIFYSSILSYLLVGFIFSYLIAPVVTTFEKQGIPRLLSILLIYILIGFAFYLMIEAIVPQVVQQYNGLKNIFIQISQKDSTINLHSIGLGSIADTLEKLENNWPELKIQETIGNVFNLEKITAVINQFPLLFKGVFNLLAFMVVVPVISFFLLKDERLILKYFFSKIPNRYFEFSLHLFEKIEESFGRFFRAILLETILVAVMTIIGLLILRIPYALVLGIIAGLANPIKYFGPFIGAVPTLLTVLITSTPTIYIVHVSIMFLIVQQIDSLFLFPWLVGKSMDMHPLWVLLTVIAGGYAFGILGMLLGVPVVFLLTLIIEVSHVSLKDFEII